MNVPCLIWGKNALHIYKTWYNTIWFRACNSFILSLKKKISLLLGCIGDLYDKICHGHATSRMDNLSNVHSKRAAFLYFDSMVFKPNAHSDIFFESYHKHRKQLCPAKGQLEIKYKHIPHRRAPFTSGFSLILFLKILRNISWFPLKMHLANIHLYGC